MRLIGKLASTADVTMFGNIAKGRRKRDMAKNATPAGKVCSG